MSISRDQARRFSVLCRSNAALQDVSARWLRSLLVGALILVCGLRVARANYRYWTDATGDHFWSTAANWSPNIAPISGDILVFGQNPEDSGTTSGTTIVDITNINVQELRVEADTENFTLISTAGPLHIYSKLWLYDSSGHTGLSVDCPLVIENGGTIEVDSLYNSTGIDFNAPIVFTAGGGITANGPDATDIGQTVNHISFNAGMVCTNDLHVECVSLNEDAQILFGDLTVYGNMFCEVVNSGGSPDQTTINFGGADDNYIQNTLYLDTLYGESFHFSKPANTLVAQQIDVRPGPFGSTAPIPIHLDNPGNFGAASTLIIEQGAVVNLSGNNPIMGVVRLEHQSADATPPVLNVGSTVPGFGPGSAIFVIHDSSQGNPQIQGNIRLDGTQLNVDGAVPSFLEIDGNIQGSGFNKTGPGTLLLNGANNFTGGVTNSGGTLQPANTAALNIASSGSLHLNGGTLSAKYLNLANVPLYVDGPFSGLQAFTPWNWSGPVFLNSTLAVTPIDLNGTNAAINFSGPITGPGGLVLQGAFLATGSVVLSGPDANTFAGPITHGCLLLEFDKPANVPAFSGPLIVGGGGPYNVEFAEARWLNSEQGATPNVTLYSNAIVNLNNFNENFGAITFNGGLIETGNGRLSLAGDVTVNPAGVTATITGNMAIASISSAIFDVAAGGVDPDLLIQASVTGTAPSVVKTGPGILRFAGNNSFTAGIGVSQGMLEVGNSQALGNPANVLAVASGAALQVEPGVSVPETINLSGSLTVPAGQSVALTGPITLQADTTINVQGNNLLQIDAAITGAGSLTKAGTGTLFFGGTTPNTYTGGTQVSDGTLVLNKQNGALAVPGQLTIGNQNLFNHGGPSFVVQYCSDCVGGTVTVNGSGNWSLAGGSQSLSASNAALGPVLTLRDGGSVQTGTGFLYIPTNGDLQVIPGYSGTSTISGNIGLDPGPHNFDVGQRSATIAGPECKITANISQNSGVAQLNKISPGTLILTGTNNYTGYTIVSNGTLEIDGWQPDSIVQVYAAMLQGSGLVGDLEMDDPNAVLLPFGMTCGGGYFNAGATPGGTFQVNLSGETPGALYSQLQASPVSLSNLNLTASLNFPSQYGDQFTIVKNNGGPAPVGAFNGLPEGSLFSISGEMFQITYHGGSGGDVVLTHLSPTNQPGVATWINTSGGDWNNGANWTTGVVPNGADAVVAVSTSCVISNNANVSPAQMLFNSPLATIGGSGNIAVSGFFEWEAGTFNGSGSLAANGVFHLYSPTSSTLSLIGESLINSAYANWGANTPIVLSGGAILSNTASGTFDCESDGTIQNGSGTNLIVNNGVFRKIDSVGTTRSEPFFNSVGTLSVVSGTLDLAGGGTLTGPVGVNLAAGAKLSFSAGISTILSSIYGAGELDFLGGTVNLYGPVTTLGAHNFTGGVINLGDNYDPSSNAVTIGPCTVNFNGTNPISAGSLTVGGYGSLGGSNTVTVTGPMVWNNSFTITGSNSVIANGGLTIAAGGGLLGRTLVNTASTVWSNAGIGTLVLGLGATISNAPGATFDCMGINNIDFTAGGGTVANAGLFRIIGPPAAMTVSTPFNNSGTVEVQAGTLSLSGGGSNTGTINVFANAALSVGSGSPTQSFVQGPGASITGPGQLLVTSTPGNANLGGTVNLGGSNIFIGGTANLTGNYVCSNAPLVIGACTANFNCSNVISPSSLTLSGYGSLGGSNLVTVSGPMMWNNSFTITGGNSVIANGGLTIPGGVGLIGRTLVNMGPAVCSNSTLTLGGGAVLSNAPGATLDCVGPNVIQFTSGSGMFANAGLFQSLGPSADTTIQVPFSNSAVVEVQSGVLSLADGGSSISTSNSIAEIAVFSNATIDFHGGTFFLDPSAIIDGPGNLSVSGGTANLAGEVDLSGTHAFSGGTANITGLYNCVSNSLIISGGTANFNGSGVIAPSSLTLGGNGSLGGSNLVTVSGPMIWNNSFGITGSNSVIANGGLTITPGNVSISGRTLVNAGAALWTNSGSGAIYFSGGAMLSNAPGATFDCFGNATIGFGSGGGIVANNGLFRIRGAGAQTTTEVPFTNNGIVEVDAGAFGVSFAPYVQMGGLTFLNGGGIANSTTPLQIMGGALTGGGAISGSVTNAALLNPGAPFGRTTIGGSYTQTAAGALAITLAGTNPGTGFNSLAVGGAANLGGALVVSLTNGFEPAIGTRFQILSCAGRSGVFSALNVPTGISVNYSNNAVFLVVTGAVVLPATLQLPQLSGGNFTFNFQTASNQSYTIQENTNLSTTNWFFVPNFTGNGALFQFVMPVTTAPQDLFPSAPALTRNP